MGMTRVNGGVRRWKAVDEGGSTGGDYRGCWRQRHTSAKAELRVAWAATREVVVVVVVVVVAMVKVARAARVERCRGVMGNSVLGAMGTTGMMGNLSKAEARRTPTTTESSGSCEQSCEAAATLLSTCERAASEYMSATCECTS